MDKNPIGGSTVIAVQTADTIKQDASCKIVLKDRYFLAGILKSVVTEYKDVPLRDIAEKYIEPDSISDSTPVSRNLTNSRIKGASEGSDYQ